MQQLPAQVGAEILERRRGDQSSRTLEEIRLGDVDGRDRRRADAAEVARPVEARRRSPGARRRSSCGRCARDRGVRRVERRLASAVSSRITVAASVAACAAGRAGEREQARHVVDVLLPDLDRAGVVPEVVVAVGQAEAALSAMPMTIEVSLKSASAPKAKNAPTPILCSSASSSGRRPARRRARRCSSGPASSGVTPRRSIAASSMQLA